MHYYIYSLNKGLDEDIVWRSDIFPLVRDLSENLIDIWHYGFTEILNNAIDHSSGTVAFIFISRTAASTTMIVCDDGEGIFKKIQRNLGLHKESHSVLELAKGKLTTDPENHTGEGIFFTSRMFDFFLILSGPVYFAHKFEIREDLLIKLEPFKPSLESGTIVYMEISNNIDRTTKQVFDSFTTDDDYLFTKTVVPVLLAQYGDDKLFSRSQAKRLLARVNKFKVVILDFDGVKSIGQAFSDEIFRVFSHSHPEIELGYVNANKDVQHMIKRAKFRDE